MMESGRILSNLESEVEHMDSMREEALAALGAKGEVERRLAQVGPCPPSRHAAFAALMAILVASPAAAPAIRWALLALGLVGVVLIIRWDKRRLGMFINGYRRGKTLLVTVPVLLLIEALYAASFDIGVIHGRPHVSLVLAAGAFGLAYAGSTVWQRVFLRELGA